MSVCGLVDVATDGVSPTILDRVWQASSAWIIFQWMLHLLRPMMRPWLVNSGDCLAVPVVPTTAGVKRKANALVD